MSLIATLKRIETDGNGLSNDKRPGIMDGSLSEIITQALNYARSRRDFYSEEPYFGKDNGQSEFAPPPPGGGTVTNIKRSDEPYQNPLRPSLETQAIDEALVQEIGTQLGDSIVDAMDEESVSNLGGRPVLMYAIPEDGEVPEEMNSDIEDKVESGAYRMADFVFVHTDSAKMDNREQVVDLNEKITAMQAKGAKVYKDLNSFLSDLPDILKKR